MSDMREAAKEAVDQVRLISEAAAQRPIPGLTHDEIVRSTVQIISASMVANGVRDALNEFMNAPMTFTGPDGEEVELLSNSELAELLKDIETTGDGIDVPGFEDLDSLDLE